MNTKVNLSLKYGVSKLRILLNIVPGSIASTYVLKNLIQLLIFFFYISTDDPTTVQKPIQQRRKKQL